MPSERALPYPGAVVDRSRLAAWRARNLLKRRLILSLDEPGVGGSSSELAGFKLIRLGAGSGASPTEAQRSALVAAIGAERLERRLAATDMAVFLAVTEREQELAGFVWAVQPHERTVFHDNVPVRPGVALLFHGLVLPDHRRKHLFTRLMVAVQSHCLVELGCNAVLGVVEASNLASLSTLKTLGYRHVGDNYLIKLLGLNVVSVVRWYRARRTEVHLVLMTRRGRSL